MKATDANFLSFIDSAPQFVIPIYQRTYSWTEKECRQLWNDILRAGQNQQVPGRSTVQEIESFVSKECRTNRAKGLLITFYGETMASRWLWWKPSKQKKPPVLASNRPSSMLTAWRGCIARVQSFFAATAMIIGVGTTRCILRGPSRASLRRTSSSYCIRDVRPEKSLMMYGPVAV